MNFSQSEQIQAAICVCALLATKSHMPQEECLHTLLSSAEMEINMKKEKDIKLVNIYIKIHNKKVLTMDDLAYLAKYNPECFKKTCDNLIYKIPETKTLVASPQETPAPEKKENITAESGRTPFDMTADEKLYNERMIMQFLESLKKAESSDVSALQNVDIAQVKELVGNLFMENLFPHDGMQGYFDVHAEESASAFNVRV